MLNFYSFPQSEEQAKALAEQIGVSIQNLLKQQPHVTLAVSGGNSPRLTFQKLAQRALEWNRINITLVDDRWLPNSHSDSNEKLVRETLLIEHARHATFYPIVNIDEEADAWAENLAHQIPKIDMALLGMGEDGHTASLFADAPQWKEALTTSSRYLILKPQHAPYQRISLSFHTLFTIPYLFLLINGDYKKQVFTEALKNQQSNAMSILLQKTSHPISVFWAS